MVVIRPDSTKYFRVIAITEIKVEFDISGVCRFAPPVVWSMTESGVKPQQSKALRAGLCGH